MDALVASGVKTTSVDDYSAGRPENNRHLEGNPLFKAVRADVSSKAQMRELLPGIDVVFHQAASKKTVCLRDPRRDLEVNAGGTLNLLELAVEFGVKKFVHASTGSVYGEPIYFPTDESHPLAPTSYYGVSKLAGERYVKAFEHLFALNVTVLRYFHVYGPRQESSDVGGVVSIFCRRLLEGKDIIIHGDGTQVRSFTNVKDIVTSNLMAAQIPASAGRVFNCASGIRVTVSDLAMRIAKHLGIKHPSIQYDDWTPGDIREFYIDNKACCEVLGIQFLTDFDAGLSETVNWAVEYFGGK